jgi:hypothetical protein
MNALLILKTTKSNVRQNYHLPIPNLLFKTNKRKKRAAGINANNELIFQNKEKVKRAAELMLPKKKQSFT